MPRIAYDYIIVGGGIAGVTAAETIREKHSTATIAVISDEPHLLYSRVLIPAYLKRRISRNQLFLRTADDFTKKGIDLHLGQRVASVDAKQKLVILAGGLAFGFKKLLLASGGAPKPWGEEQYQKFFLRMQTLEDADRIMAALPGTRHPLVVGSSFIGLEFLEVFFLHNLRPTLLSRDEHFFARFLDPKGGELMRANFARHGIESYFQDSVREIKTKAGRPERAGLPAQAGELAVGTERLLEISCDILGVAVGLSRNTDFLAGSGIEFGKAGIRTNEFLETNAAGIYAAGDVAQFLDTVAGKLRTAGNWTNAFLQGKRAGLNMAGAREPYRQVSSYSITNLGFQITVLGECAPEGETIVRLDELNNQYERIFIKDGAVAGAALINRFQDKPHLSKLIETKTPVGNFREKLASLEFDIRLIPPLS